MFSLMQKLSVCMIYSCICVTPVTFTNSSFFHYSLFLSYDSQGQNRLSPQTAPSARRSKVLVCGRSLVGMGGSKPTREMVVSIL
jgi:hypothetical protein